MASTQRSGGRTRTRSVTSTILLVIGAVLFTAGIVAGSVYDTIFSAQRFTGTAVKTIQHPEVKAEISNALVDQIIAQKPDLIAARPLIGTVVDTVIGSKPFKKILTAALLQLHQTFFTTDKPTLVLDVSDGMTIVLNAVKAYDPNLAASIPPSFRSGLIKLSDRPYAADIVGIGRTVSRIALALGIVGFLALVGAVAVAANRRRALTYLGIALGLGVLIAWLGLDIGKRVLIDQVDGFTTEQAVAAVYDTFFEELRLWLKIVGIFGVVLAAAASASVRLTTARMQLENIRRIVTRAPASRWGKLIYAAVVMIVGGLLIAFPSTMLVTAIRAVGLLTVYLALTEVVRLAGWATTYDPIAAAGERPARVGVAVRPLAIAALAGIVLLSGFGVWVNRDALRSDEAVSAADITTCNGYKELCDRRLNEVVFAATHNSMSSAREPGWLNAEHDGTIIDQLDAGVHALLIDAHYGYAGSGGVSTDMSDPSARKIVEAGVDPETIAAAQRIAARRVTGANANSKREVFLCHVFCELGATPLDTSLGQIYDWLEENPNEVIILFFEDYVSPEDMAASFDRSLLADYVYTQPPGAPFPTLREMIEKDERVVVLSENVGSKPKPDWYHDGFSLVQETPYTFKTPQEFSCAPNRGKPENPLFQINHWIEKIPPSPSDAAVVNAYDFLLARARQCQQERGHLPNILAVDFYETGDLLRVVATLNGVGPPPGDKP